MPQTNLVETERAVKVCKIGREADCCRYLMGGRWGLECGKGNESAKKELDKRVEAGLMVAQGDNCEGIK